MRSALPVPVRELPPSEPTSGVWRVLPAASEVGFRGRASRFAPTVQAAFTGVTGTVVLDDEHGGSSVDVVIDLTTLATGNPVYDELLAHADPFGIRRHPTARFRSVAVERDVSRCTVTGVLELAGTTSVLTLHGSSRTSDDPATGTATAELTAIGTVATSVLGPVALPGAALLVPKKMTLEIRVLAQRCAVPTPRRGDG